MFKNLTAHEKQNQRYRVMRLAKISRGFQRAIGLDFKLQYNILSLIVTDGGTEKEFGKRKPSH